MAATRQLGWRQIEPTAWQRDLDEVEEFYSTLAYQYQNSGRTFFSITGHLSVSVERPSVDDKLEAAFKQAWLQLRTAQPTIASWVEAAPDQKRFVKKYQEPTSNNDLAAWVKETFLLVETHLSGLEWCNSDPPVPKLPTLFLLKSKGDGSSGNTRLTIVLRSPHDVIDGVGTLILLGELMRLVGAAFDGAKFDRSGANSDHELNLSPPLRIAASLPRSLNSAQQARLDQIKLHNKTIREGTEVLKIPAKSDTKLPGRHQRIALALSSEQTSSILRACKTRDITVTHAYHAAIAISLRDLQNRDATPRTVRYITYCLMNERQSCSSPYNSPEHAAALYHTVSGEHLAIDLKVRAEGEAAPSDTSKDFDAIVPQFKSYYESLRNDSDRLAFIPHFWAAGTPAVDWSIPASEQPVPPPGDSPSASLSSFGDIGKIVSSTFGEEGKIKVDNPWVTGEELGNGLGVFLGTWEGRLHVSAAYNDAFQEREEVEKFLGSVQAVVESALT